ncbi:MAG: hypothetical protein K5648_00585 [Erysipelotrichaceae bacterium]|nr:hypothetical protein [Erysipelotrichaceae bacterium]
MEYIGFVFGIFGLMAYMEISGLKKRIAALEEQLSKFSGTSYAEHKQSLKAIVQSLVNEEVSLKLKEDQEDFDIINYGNTKYGSNVLLDADGDWIKVRIVSPKKEKIKLLRLSSVASITKKN